VYNIGSAATRLVYSCIFHSRIFSRPFSPLERKNSELDHFENAAADPHDRNCQLFYCGDMRGLKFIVRCLD